MVSIIIPAYNAESYIEETLKSVCATQYSPLQIIVVNDGSTDRTLDIAKDIAKHDNRIQVIDQKNSGVCTARNHAISEAKGKYILPVDADDIIEPNLVSEAVDVLKKRPEVMVVTPNADFFGAKNGPWHLPTFSRNLLARKNILIATSMYRKTDWERIGGYSTDMIAREDWDFWIAMLKDGGEVVRLPQVLFHYRVSANSKRFQDRKHNYTAIKLLNKRHPEFFNRELGGPLRRMRSWSKMINRIRYHKSIDTSLRFVKKIAGR